MAQVLIRNVNEDIGESFRQEAGPKDQAQMQGSAPAMTLDEIRDGFA